MNFHLIFLIHIIKILKKNDYTDMLKNKKYQINKKLNEED